IVIIVRLRCDDGDDLAARMRLGLSDRGGNEIMVCFADVTDFLQGSFPLPAARGAATAKASATAGKASESAASAAPAAAAPRRPAATAAPVVIAPDNDGSPAPRTVPPMSFAATPEGIEHRQDEEEKDD